MIYYYNVFIWQVWEGFVEVEENIGEDCLYFNIYIFYNVMIFCQCYLVFVYIYGGGFFVGIFVCVVLFGEYLFICGIIFVSI